jgi:hypothetical protein
MKESPMTSRRHFIFVFAAAAFAMFGGAAFAAPPSVEIIAMVHPPVQSALKPLREWLAAQGGKLKLGEIDAESAAGEKRLAALGLKGHIPIVILVDGSYRHKRKDGGAVEFVNFPAVKGSPPGALGNWTTEDVQAVLNERVK